MLLFPDVQKKAQKELDEVLGGVRLVEFEDKPSLPYIVGVCQEALRWHPLLPGATAHAVTQDDVVGEYFIPKGAIVIGNSWSLLHSEDDFGPEPDKFNPERYFLPGVRDPATTGAFGYGRRICPGRYMAENSLFIAIASILQVFEISPAIDSNEKEIPLKYEFTSGFFSHPTDFQCAIKPRSKDAEKLILQG